MSNVAVLKMALMKNVALNVVGGKVRANIIKTGQEKTACQSVVRNVHISQSKSLVNEFVLIDGR